jgi:hypothetical protein
MDASNDVQSDWRRLWSSTTMMTTTTMIVTSYWLIVCFCRETLYRRKSTWCPTCRCRTLRRKWSIFTCQLASLPRDPAIALFTLLAPTLSKVCCCFCCCCIGKLFSFSAFVGSLKATLQSARPTLFFGVPRVWEKFAEAIKVCFILL